jgi:hypothetical protein
MFDDEYFDQYTSLLESKPELYVSIEIHGVKGEFDPEANETICEVDDNNPQFFSAYTRDLNNEAYCIADAGMSKLEDLRTLAKNLAVQHNWECQDFTFDKPYWTCEQCRAKVTTLFDEAYCAQCYESIGDDTKLIHLPVGTRIISIQGETSDTDSGQDVFTGPNADGVICYVLFGQEHCYSVNFPLGVSVLLSQAELADNNRYQVLPVDVQVADDRRVIAHFQPQAWVHDTAMDIDGACDLDVTGRVLVLAAEVIHQLEDDDYPSDELVYGLTDHVGPHYVSVKESILEFFDVDQLVDITEEMLGEKRLLYTVPSSSNGVKKHNVHIYAIVRVKVCDIEAESHADAIQKAEVLVDLNDLFNKGADQEFADDIDCFLVDEIGDEDYRNSRWYEKDGVTRMAQSQDKPS